MQRTQSNVSILNAWFNLEKALIDAQVAENEQVTIISRPPTSKMMRDYSNYHSHQRAQSLRPLTGLTRPSTAITMKKPFEYQEKTATIQQSQRKIFRKKVNQRPYKKYGFDNIHIQKEEIENDISEEELNQSTVIHTLEVDQIIDLYHCKCKDRELEYQPEHAVLFIQKFQKLCIYFFIIQFQFYPFLILYKIKLKYQILIYLSIYTKVQNFLSQIWNFSQNQKQIEIQKFWILIQIWKTAKLEFQYIYQNLKNYNAN